MFGARRPGDDERIARVAAVAELREVVLSHLLAKRLPALPTEKALDADIQTRGKHDVTEDGVLQVALYFSFVTKPEAFNLTAVFALNYQLRGSVEEADAEAFARVNAVFNAWPYWRELVQSTISRMGFPAPLIPLLRL